MILDDRLRMMTASLDIIERNTAEARKERPEIPEELLLLDACYREAQLLQNACNAEPAEAYNGMNTFLQAVLWRRLGKPCFEISAGLGVLLAGTDVPSLDMSWVKLPFKSCCLLFQDCPVKILLSDGNMHSVHGIMVCEISGLKSERILRIEAIQAGAGALGHSTFLWIPLEPGRTVRQTLDYVRKEFEEKLGSEIFGYSPSWLNLFPSREDAIRVIMDEQQELLSLVVNTLLYLTNAEEKPEIEASPRARVLRKLRDTKSPGKRKKLERQLETASDVVIRKYGTKIVIDRRIEEEQLLAGQVRRSGKKYVSRFMVRGHWRNQACGEGMKDHKLLFIQPYWKGPKDGAELVRDYFVK